MHILARRCRSSCGTDASSVPLPPGHPGRDIGSLGPAVPQVPYAIKERLLSARSGARRSVTSLEDMIEQDRAIVRVHAVPPGRPARRTLGHLQRMSITRQIGDGMFK
jgi:hypothetical protein